MTTTRQLVLLRHAEAGHTLGQSDLDRSLTPRGLDQAARVGERLAEHVADGVDLAVVSPARRTQQTWEAVARALRADDVVTDRTVYEASVDDLLRVVAELPESALTVVLVGHAPGIPALADALSGPAAAGTVSGDLLTEVHTGGWHPATWGVVHLAGEWADATPGSGELRHLEHAG